MSAGFSSKEQTMFDNGGVIDCLCTVSRMFDLAPIAERTRRPRLCSIEARNSARSRRQLPWQTRNFFRRDGCVACISTNMVVCLSDLRGCFVSLKGIPGGCMNWVPEEFIKPTKYLFWA